VQVADHLFGALEALGIGPSRLWRPRLVAPAWDEPAARWWREHAGPARRPVVALHPGSGGAQKCWPRARYAELAERLLGRGYGVLILLGPAEAPCSAGWQAFAGRWSAAVCAANLDLPLVAALLRRCAAYVGNDSGVTHLAAALGVPTLAIFGPTDPGRWAPLGPRVRVLRDPAWPADGEVGPGACWSVQAAEVEAVWPELLTGGHLEAPPP
jgi:ADP-heptose:LPS heptosyltransferase